MAYSTADEIHNAIDKLDAKQLAFLIKTLMAAGHVDFWVIGRAIDIAETVKP